MLTVNQFLQMRDDAKQITGKQDTNTEGSSIIN